MALWRSLSLHLNPWSHFYVLLLEFVCLFGYCVCAVLPNLALKSYKLTYLCFSQYNSSKCLAQIQALMPQHSFLRRPGLYVCAHGHPWQELCALLADAPGDDLALGPTMEEPHGRLNFRLSGKKQWQSCCLPLYSGLLTPLCHLLLQVALSLQVEK